MFRSSKTGEALKIDESFVVKQIPKQLPLGLNEEDVQANAAASTNTMYALVVVQLLAQFILKKSVDELWVMFFTLQLCVYYSIYVITFPANTEVFVDEFRNLVEFKILNPEGIIKVFYPEFTLKKFMFGVKTKIETHSD